MSSAAAASPRLLLAVSRRHSGCILVYVPLVDSLRRAYGKLFGRGPYDPEKLYEAKTDMQAGPTGGRRIDADRDFKKPRP